MLLQPRYLFEPPAWFYPRILVGAGEMLTPAFCTKYKITHVINCAFPEDSPAWFRTQNPTRYVGLSAEDSMNVNILRWYPAFEAALSTFLREPNSNTVFIHCQCGINRSAFLALTYSTTHFSMPYDSTFALLKKQRPCMFTNPVFRKQTETFVNGCVPNS